VSPWEVIAILLAGVAAGSAVSVEPMSTRFRTPPVCFGMPAISCMEEPRPSSALVNSEGMTHTLLASPFASSGIIWRYW
jgi:hypothetical protein